MPRPEKVDFMPLSGPVQKGPGESRKGQDHSGKFMRRRRDWKRGSERRRIEPSP